MMIRGINRRYAKVKMGWILDPGSKMPRLVIIYVDEKG